MPGVSTSTLFPKYAIDDYYTGTTSVTINQATQVVIHLQAAGGSGKSRTVATTIDGSAGGGGGYAKITRQILQSEIGGTLTVSIGNGVAGAAGGNTTLSGTLNGSAVSITCNGGGAGTQLVDGSGGSASGGDTNITGESGYGFVSGPPGEELPGTAGRGGCFDQPDAIMYEIPVGPGSGGFAATTDIPGVGGFIRFIWS